MMTLERMILGGRYMKISKELQKYERLPRFMWSKEIKKVVVSLLEEQSEMDLELAEYLIKDGDYIGMQTLKNNQKYVAEQLWNLKRDLAM